MRISDWSSDVCSSDLLNFAVSTAVLATMLAAAPAYAQDTAELAATEAGDDGIIVVTARKRDETLSDVPIAVTAIDGDTLTARGINSVREAAVLSPGLNINSDGSGRAFVAIRGVGVTLVQSVQPGVGLFIDGIYHDRKSVVEGKRV